MNYKKKTYNFPLLDLTAIDKPNPFLSEKYFISG